MSYLEAARKERSIERRRQNQERIVQEKAQQQEERLRIQNENIHLLVDFREYAQNNSLYIIEKNGEICATNNMWILPFIGWIQFKDCLKIVN